MTSQICWQITSYDEASAIDDLLLFVENVFNVTFAEGDEIPPILQIDLWRNDFEDFLRSVFDGKQNLDFTV